MSKRNIFAALVSAAFHGSILATLLSVKTSSPHGVPEYVPFELMMLAPPNPNPEAEIQFSEGSPPAASVEELPEPEVDHEIEPDPEPTPIPQPKPIKKLKPKKEKSKTTQPKPKIKLKEAPVNVQTSEPRPEVTINTSTINAPTAVSEKIGNQGSAIQNKGIQSEHSHISGGSNSMKSYQTGLRRAIERNKPRNARSRGVVVIGFTITSNGEFSNIHIEKSSGNSTLDQAALNTVQRTNSYYAPPNGAMSVTLPIKFD